MLWKNTWNEWIKIATKTRSYIGIGALTVLVTVVLFALKADGSSFVSFATSNFEQTLSFNGKALNGNLVGFIILQMLIVHVPLLIALVTGDLLSGEEATGTIRMLATKPISRTKIVLSKWLSACFYTLIMVVWLCFLSMFVGRLLFGTGDLIVLNSNGLVIIPFDDLDWRFAIAFLIAFLSLLTVSSLSLCLSAFAKNSVGPIVSTMAVIILFTIIGALDVSVFEYLKKFMFTTHMLAWRSLFEDPLPWGDVYESIFILIAHIVLLLSITIIRFNRKDITS